MKNRRISLAVKISILIIVIIFAVFAIQQVISTRTYTMAVFEPYADQLAELKIPFEELDPYLRYFQGFLGSDELNEARRQSAETGTRLILWMNEQPGLPSDDPAAAKRTLLNEMLTASVYIDSLREEVKLDSEYTEAVLNGKTYRIFESVRGTDASRFAEDFGMDSAYITLQPQDYASPVLRQTGDRHEYIRCITYETEGCQWRFWITFDMTKDVARFHGVRFNSIVTVVFLSILFFFASMFLLNRFLIRPVRSLAKAATDFTPEEDGTYSGEKISRVDIRTRDELSDLSREIRSMQGRIVDDTKNLASMTAERQRVATELGLAEKIQAFMLPGDFPDRPEFDLYASMTPALDVGGDFYDFFLIDDDHLALVIADVSGKGIPAALFMMVSMALIQNQLENCGDPATTLERVNRQLYRRNTSCTFVTVWLAVLEISTGKCTICNAGHEHPAVHRAGGQYELIRYKHDRAIGIWPTTVYHTREFELHPGDSLFVYTDGVAEASSAAKEFFGEARLTETLNRNPDAGPEELIRGVHEALDRFAEGAPQFDDITMLCLRYNGKQS